MLHSTPQEKPSFRSLFCHHLVALSRRCDMDRTQNAAEHSGTHALRCLAASLPCLVLPHACSTACLFHRILVPPHSRAGTQQTYERSLCATSSRLLLHAALPIFRCSASRRSWRAVYYRTMSTANQTHTKRESNLTKCQRQRRQRLMTAVHTDTQIFDWLDYFDRFSQRISCLRSLILS